MVSGSSRKTHPCPKGASGVHRDGVDVALKDMQELVEREFVQDDSKVEEEIVADE